jgi:hypothetical protein
MKDSHREEQQYRRLVVMAALSFLAMYALMYAMVDSVGHVYMNVNQVYMAGLMTAPMIVIELWVMRSMYQNGRLNAVIGAASVLTGMAMFGLIRQQTAISDRQFLRSMIPHHSGAILMCQDASLQYAEIQALCKTIVAGQQAEIDRMAAKLRAMNADR